MHLCCDKEVIKWLPKPIHVYSGLFYTIQYNYITHHSELTHLQSHLHTNNPVN